VKFYSEEIEMKVCKDCKHMKVKRIIFKYTICHHPDAVDINPVSGEKIFHSCIFLRAWSANPCGPKGELFEPIVHPGSHLSRPQDGGEL